MFSSGWNAYRIDISGFLDCEVFDQGLSLMRRTNHPYAIRRSDPYRLDHEDHQDGAEIGAEEVDALGGTAPEQDPYGGGQGKQEDS